MRPPSTRAESNRLNSRKSTGPKTSGGKARSCRNALKHGLAAEVLLPAEPSAEVVATRARAMAESLHPQGPTESEMSDRAAFLALRLDRCVAAETMRSTERIHRAIADHDEMVRIEVRAIVESLALDPASTIRKLKRTSQGVDQLVDLWQEIRDVLGHGADLERRDYDRIAHLLGRHAEASCVAPILMMARGAIQGDFDDAPNPIFVPKHREATKIACRHKLDALIEFQIDQLEAHRSTLPHAGAELDRQEAPLRAVVDLSHQGALLRRYETAAARELLKIFAYFDGSRPLARTEEIDASPGSDEGSRGLASFRNSAGSGICPGVVGERLDLGLAVVGGNPVGRSRSVQATGCGGVTRGEIRHAPLAH